MRRGHSAANTRGPLAGPAGESPEKNRQVAGRTMQIRDVVVQACVDIMLLLGSPGLPHSYCSSNSNSRPSRHRLNLKRSPRKLRRLRLHSCIDAQISESAPDDTAREPQVLRFPIG